MKFKKLFVSNWKCFLGFHQIPFGPKLTCIVGPNGSGKSAICDALLFLFGDTTSRDLRGSLRQSINQKACDSDSKCAAHVSLLVMSPIDNSIILLSKEIRTDRNYSTRNIYHYALSCELPEIHTIEDLKNETKKGKKYLQEEFEAFLIEQCMVDVTQIKTFVVKQNQAQSLIESGLLSFIEKFCETKLLLETQLSLQRKLEDNFLSISDLEKIELQHKSALEDLNPSIDNLFKYFSLAITSLKKLGSRVLNAIQNNKGNKLKLESDIGENVEKLDVHKKKIEIFVRNVKSNEISNEELEVKKSDLWSTIEKSQIEIENLETTKNSIILNQKNFLSEMQTLEKTLTDKKREIILLREKISKVNSDKAALLLQTSDENYHKEFLEELFSINGEVLRVERELEESKCDLNREKAEFTKLKEILTKKDTMLQKLEIELLRVYQIQKPRNAKDNRYFADVLEKRINCVKNIPGAIGWFRDLVCVESRTQCTAVNAALQYPLKNSVLVSNRKVALDVVENFRQAKAGSVVCDVLTEMKARQFGNEMPPTGFLFLRDILGGSGEVQLAVEKWCGKILVGLEGINSAQRKAKEGFDVVTLEGDFFKGDGEIQSAGPLSNVELWGVHVNEPPQTTKSNTKAFDDDNKENLQASTHRC
eukprot:GHVP01030108.1.p1 GENE.GHVP01030108.1~~GHVP01030108.1.p1  ORF type:complete len:648 (+),score=133.18 GHVP01030108.1:216-2159(+)